MVTHVLKLNKVPLFVKKVNINVLGSAAPKLALCKQTVITAM